MINITYTVDYLAIFSIISKLNIPNLYQMVSAISLISRVHNILLYLLLIYISQKAMAQVPILGEIHYLLLTTEIEFHLKLPCEFDRKENFSIRLYKFTT